MIDPLPFATSYLDWGHLDDAESICGWVLKAKPATNAPYAHARGLTGRGSRTLNSRTFTLKPPSRIAALVHTGAACAPPHVTNGKPRCARRNLNASSENFNVSSEKMLVKEGEYDPASILAPDFRRCIVKSLSVTLPPLATDVDRGASCRA
jgi:hypothetical protein